MIDLAKFSERQVVALQDLAQPSHGSYQQVAERAGVDERTLYRWRQDPDFKRAIVQLAVQHVAEDLPDIIAASVKEAKRGKSRHTELILKMLGLLVERKEVDASVSTGASNADIERDIEQLQQTLGLTPSAAPAKAAQPRKSKKQANPDHS